MDIGSWRSYNASSDLRAITDKHVISFQYISAKNERIHRKVEPLRLMYKSAPGICTDSAEQGPITANSEFRGYRSCPSADFCTSIRRSTHGPSSSRAKSARPERSLGAFIRCDGSHPSRIPPGGKRWINSDARNFMRRLARPSHVQGPRSGFLVVLVDPAELGEDIEIIEPWQGRQSKLEKCQQKYDSPLSYFYLQCSQESKTKKPKDDHELSCKMYEYHVWANQAIFNRLLEPNCTIRK